MTQACLFGNVLTQNALLLAFPAILLPFFIASVFFRVYPTRRALALFCVPTVAAAANFAFDQLGPSSVFFWATLALDAFVIVALIVDVALLAGVGANISATRSAEQIASLGNPLDVRLTVENRSDRDCLLEIVDDSSPYSVAIPPRRNNDLTLDESIDDYDLENPIAFFERRLVPAHTKETLDYRIVWTRRGLFNLEFVALRFSGILKLWTKYVNAPCKTEFRVFPNLCQLTQMELVARKSRLYMLGVRRTRRVGQDADFERLRDYTIDDQYKFIDWKATGRRNKLIVRDFQTTRNQRVILALDAGRMTMNLSDGVTLFDSALNATLALAYIALRQGDEVGFMVFSNEVKRYVPPRGGASQMNALIRAVFDVFPERVESRYDRAFSYLKTHAPKRALVVLVTNILDERNADQIEKCLTNLAGSHLPLGLFMRERALFEPLENFAEVENRVRKRGAGDAKTQRANAKLELMQRQYRERDPVDEIERLYWRRGLEEDASPEELFFRSGAAAEIINWRRKTISSLEAKGALTLDVYPEDAAAPLINKYLEIKARRLL